MYHVHVLYIIYYVLQYSSTIDIYIPYCTRYKTLTFLSFLNVFNAIFLTARFMNSAVLTFLVTRKSDFLSAQFVSKIQIVMILDIIVPPILRLLDVYNVFMRYVIAPQSKSQALMNKHFNGTFWNLAERYTDAMKKVFFCFYYAWVCPSGFGITAIGLLVDYYVDKYLLLRRWRTPPAIGPHLSIASRVYFYLSVCVATFLFIWAFRSWPFDCSFLLYTSSQGTCEEEFSREAMYSLTRPMTWPASNRSVAATVGIPALVVIMIVAALAAVNRTLFAAGWFCLKAVCCTDSKIVPLRSERGQARHDARISKFEKRRMKRVQTYGRINDGMQAGLGGILYSQLPHADWYIPRARASMAEVAKADLVHRWFYITQSQMQDIYRPDWTFAGQTSTDPEEFASKKIYFSGNWLENKPKSLSESGTKWHGVSGATESGKTKETEKETVGFKLLEQFMERKNNATIDKQAPKTNSQRMKQVSRHVVPWYFYACDSVQVNAYLTGETHHQGHQTEINAAAQSVQALLTETVHAKKLTIQELIAASPSVQGGFIQSSATSGPIKIKTIEELLYESPSVADGSLTLT